MSKTDPTDINIRKATEADVETLAAFQQAMALEVEGLVLEADVVVEGVRAVFLTPEKGFYLTAEAGGRMVGGLLITYEWSDWTNATYWWLQSVYVARDWRRSGVFRSLYDHVRQEAELRGDICGIRLYVYKSNLAAQKTYESLRMARSHYEMYELDIPPAS